MDDTFTTISSTLPYDSPADVTFTLQTGNSPRVTHFRGRRATCANNVATIGSGLFDAHLIYRLNYNC